MPSSPSIFNDCYASGCSRFEPVIWVGSNLLEINSLGVVAQIFPRWNPLTGWLRHLEALRRAA